MLVFALTRCSKGKQLPNKDPAPRITLASWAMLEMKPHAQARAERAYNWV